MDRAPDAGVSGTMTLLTAAPHTSAHVRVDGEHASVILRDGLPVPVPNYCAARSQLLQDVIQKSGNASDQAAIPLSEHLLLRWMLHAEQTAGHSSAEESVPMDAADYCQLLIVRFACCLLSIARCP